MFKSLLKAVDDIANDVQQQQQQRQQQPHVIRATRPDGQPEDPPVALSKCDGHKRALFIGINYFGSKAELHGCLNDVAALKEFVTTRYGFKDILVLTDDQKSDPSRMPTHANIINALRWLVEGAKEGDSLFLHYSGHGGTAVDQGNADSKDEVDGYDETIIPVDYEKSGQIIDDDLHEVLIKHLPKGVRLTAIFDSCHSGSVLDLPYTYNINGNLEIQEIDNRKLAVQAAMEAGKSFLMGNRAAAMSKGMEALGFYMKKGGSSNSQARNVATKTRSTLADCIQFSGCRDEQTSADAQIDGRAQGAMSASFISAFKQNPNMTYIELLANVRKIMVGKYTQVPQMSTGHQMNMNVQFIM